MDAKSYQHAIGAPMHPMPGTRPNLAHPAAALGQHAANPGHEHNRALDRTLRHLRATSDRTHAFQRVTPQDHVDADWANDNNGRKPTSGYVFMLGGGAICWSPKKQPSDALSSTEAEHLAGTHAAKEVTWL